MNEKKCENVEGHQADGIRKKKEQGHLKLDGKENQNSKQ